MSQNNSALRHIAIIMDGNGRWAKAKNLPRTAGHRAGGDTLKNIVRAAGQMGLAFFSVYAFSTENKGRPKAEVNALMKLLVEFCKNQVDELIENNTKLVFIGNIAEMGKREREAMRVAQAKTAHCTGMQFNVCINYGGRDEIVTAIKRIISDQIAIDDIDKDLVNQYLYTAGIPDPDLIIRTSGEMRLSNYYLWQAAYSEFVFVDRHWPDFTEQTLRECITVYQTRNRRFGKL